MTILSVEKIAEQLNLDVSEIIEFIKGTQAALESSKENRVDFNQD